MLVEGRDDPRIAPHYRMAFGKRPEFELFRIADDPDHAGTLATLRKRLDDFLKATGDPRATGGAAPWDAMPFYLPGNPPRRVTPDSHPFLYRNP